MITRPLTLFVLTLASLDLAVLNLGITASVPAAARDFLSPSEAERLGMVEAWHRQVAAIGGAESVVDIQVWVNKSIQYETIEVIRKVAAPAAAGNPAAAQVPQAPSPQAQVFERIPTNRRGLDGRAIGKAEAERLAKLSVLLLQRRGIEAEVRSVKVDQIRLHVLTADGGVAAYDGETGEQLWAVRIGDPALGYGTMGVNDRFVSFFNGTNLEQVVAMDGEVLDDLGLPVRTPAGRPMKSHHVRRIPVHGVVNVGTKALIPLNKMGIETHTLGEIIDDPDFEMFAGRALGKPVGYPNSRRIMWPTSEGFVYAMEVGDRPKSLFRLAVDGRCEGGVAAASDDRFFFGSTGGRVYAVKATNRGEVLWNQSVGEPFYRPPFVSGERVWISSSFGHLFCLNAQTGDQLWAQPVNDIDQIFAHAGNRIIGRDRESQLVVLDADTGETVMRACDFPVRRFVTNADTDRVYLIGEGGMVQCLRPIGSEFPVFHRQITAEPVAETKAKSAKKPGEEQPAENKPAADPFGGGNPPGADPFGGAGANEAADPFGNAPAGGAAPPAADDPFGAGAGNEPMADPFGNGGA